MTKLFETAMEGRWELVIEICINKKAYQAKITESDQSHCCIYMAILEGKELMLNNCSIRLEKIS